MFSPFQVKFLRVAYLTIGNPRPLKDRNTITRLFRECKHPGELSMAYTEEAFEEALEMREQGMRDIDIRITIASNHPVTIKDLDNLIVRLNNTLPLRKQIEYDGRESEGNGRGYLVVSLIFLSLIAVAIYAYTNHSDRIAYCSGSAAFFIFVALARGEINAMNKKTLDR
jgi:hypothetical protein